MSSARAYRVARLVVACGTVAGCVRAAASKVERGAVAASLPPGDVEALSTLLEAADVRRPDTVAIDRALASGTPVVRASAARAIGQIGVTARAGVARRLVSDPDSAVGADAAFALGSLRDSSASATLAGALRGPPTVVAAAAWSLGELGQHGRYALESVLRSGQPVAALADVLQASAKLRPVPAALIAPYLEHAHLSVRRAAAYALTRSRVPGSVRSLLSIPGRLTVAEAATAAADTGADLRSYVARGLAQPVAGDSLRAEAIATLRRLAHDPHPHVRINALRSLATFGPAVRPDVVGHLRDPDANVRIALAQALGDVFAGDRADWLLAWAADTGFTYRRSLLGLALRAGVRLPALEPNGGDGWLRHPDWRYRAAVAQAAGAGGLADIDALALPLLRDPDARVRTAAFAAAAVWADSGAASAKPYGRPALPAALNDPDLGVRATILNALRGRARAPDAAVAFAAWRRAARDAESDAGVAALRVIAVAWRTDSASFSSELRDSLSAAQPSADPAERNAGRSIGALQHWPVLVTAPKPVQWYADKVRTIVASDLVGRPITATIATTRGTVRIRLFAADAPLTVANFVQLARRRYYDGSLFHRVVPNFVAQDGDPRGDGSGGPGYAIRDELNRRWYDRGAVGMALSGPDTGGSQYFLTHSPQPHLDGHYTVFGHVVAGLDVLDAIVQGDRIVTITVQ